MGKFLATFVLLLGLLSASPVDAQADSPSPSIPLIEDAEEADAVLQKADRSQNAERLSLLLDVLRFRIDNQLFGEAENLIQSIRREFGSPTSDTLNANDFLRARYHVNHARLLLQNKDLAQGLIEAERARYFVEQAGATTLAPMVYRTLGNTFVMMRDYAKALDFFEEALKAARQLDDPNMAALTLNSIAIAHWRMEQWEDAGYYLRQARESLPPDSPRVSMFDNNIAVAIMEQGELAKARDLLLKNLANLTRKEGSRYTRALTQSNLADVFQRLLQPEKSLQYAELALQIPDKGPNAYIYARTLRHRARALLQLDQIDQAIATCKESLRYANLIDDPAEQMNTYGALIAIYESAGLYREALEALRRELALREEILSRQTRLRGVHFQVQYETAEREQRLKALQQEQRIQIWQRNGMIAILLVAVLIAVILFSRYRLHQRANKQITRQKEEIQRSHDSLQQAYHELEAANSEKDEILAIAAHDIRNPIGAARQLAEMLRDNDQGQLSVEDCRSFAGDIIQSAETVLDIVANLLDSNRLERGGVTVNWQNVSPNECLRAVADSFQHDLTRKQQKLQLDLPDSLPGIQSDQGLLRQVLANLLSNAVKYSPHQSTIFASTEFLTDQNAIRFRIRDEGPGLTREDQQRLFRKFARLSARPTGGETSTGLGLSIVHKLVTTLKGTVSCQSVLGHGTTFFVDFPASTDPS